MFWLINTFILFIVLCYCKEGDFIKGFYLQEKVEPLKETNGSSIGAKAPVVEGIVLSEFLDLEVQWSAREETLMNYQYIIKHSESRTNQCVMLLQPSKAGQKCPNRSLRKLIRWSTRRNYKGS
ncbi:hypothetical protein Bca4012_065170 [Brassica carinata]|uniref:Uncharacterized protein n=1 Tax=Brassica carinata TaxID=52824 RepID=A0A8X7VME5_BRACI|nr:hypothetical protein Bca52824_017600 [Brassica carinata]